ncbi:MAG: rhomboid family intramembrane serine protease, partial [Proteobacteria bacterium]|nr:rhomboid family intramembrane serine protease [Pseudomonadota bacterium]
MREKLVENVQIALLALAVVWAVFAADWLLSLNLFQSAGIKPRRLVGLWGIPCAPFLHAGWWHILSNSLPLVVLLFVSLTFSRRLTVRALVAIIVVGGGLVWIFGRTGVHAGASGV